MSEFQCLSSGSRPPARLSWLKNGRPIEAPGAGRRQAAGLGAESAEVINVVQDTRSFGLNSTSESRLSIKLAPGDHMAQLTCRAENVQRQRAEADGNGPAPLAGANFEPGDKGARSGAALSGLDGAEAAAAAWLLEDSITLDVHCKWKWIGHAGPGRN